MQVSYDRVQAHTVSLKMNPEAPKLPTLSTKAWLLPAYV